MILLFSGGLDSYIAWHYLKKPTTLYCDLGHRYASQEVEAVRELIPSTIIDTRLNLSDKEERDANIPLRNAFLVMIASYYSEEIVLVVQKGEMDIPDRSNIFFKGAGRSLTYLHGRKIEVLSPFKRFTKSEIVNWYSEYYWGPNDHLLKTRSCFGAGDKPCGACDACFRRWVAFTNNGIKEEYEKDILLYERIRSHYIPKMLKGEYDKDRTRETFAALSKVGYKVL